MRYFILALLSLVTLQTANAQTNNDTNDGLALLSAVGQHYADAKSYHIEAVEEESSGNELEHSWRKNLLTAIVMPGGKYHYEGRSGFGSAILISDGTTEWDYHLDAHVYSTKLVTAGDSHNQPIPMGEVTLSQAKFLWRNLAHRADHLKSATLLPEEDISIDGHDITCSVVRYSESDLKKKTPDFKEEWILWIDKQNKTIVKTKRHEETFSLPAHVALSLDSTVTYDVVRLDQEEPVASFTFVPPNDAKFVNSFSRGLESETGLSLIGNPAPQVSFKSADGKVLALSSLRGKPVFLEFWATWCGPCLALLPNLKNLYAETEAKGLTWIGVDNDEDSTSAPQTLQREHVSWANYHDEDGSIGDSFHRGSIPLGVLIDSEGKVTFYQSGYTISDLRSAIAKLGPQFATVAAATKTP